jgi:DNA-binding SARP family transcriptional activator/streptogramin lyase
MRIRILGPLEVWEDGHELPLGTGRQRALLALLLLHANEVVSTDRLIDELWGERPPATAAKAVQGYVSQLRKALPDDVLVTRPTGYLLHVGETDAGEFERLVDEARAQEPADAAGTLRRALGLWRGPPLADVEYESWAQSEVARLQELRLAALEERIDADLQLGRHAALTAELEALVAEHPLRERLRAQQMLALYRAGRQAEALSAYADMRRRLVGELGLEPGPELQDLHRRILGQDPELGPVSPPPRLTRQRSRTLLFFGAALVATVAGLVYALTGGGSHPVAVLHNSVAAIDPKTDRVVTDLAVGDGPGRLVAADGQVWSLNDASRTVSEIDAARQNGVRTFAIGHSPGDIAVGANALWTTETTTRTLEKIDPTSGAIIGSVTPHIPRLPALADGGEVAFGGGDVWFGSNHGSVTRVDPDTLRVEKTLQHLDVGPGGQIVVRQDAVWINDSFGNVTRVDPTTNDVVGEASLATQDVGGIAADSKAVWATATDQGLLWEIDAGTVAPVNSFHVGSDPVGVTLGAGAVWVANGDGTLTRLDPSSGKTRTIRVGGSPHGVVFANGLVWVGID